MKGENPADASGAYGMFHEPRFRFIVTASCGLAIGCMLASLACVEKSPSGALNLRWHWSALVLMGLGFGLGVVFWRAVWQLQAADNEKHRRRMLMLGIGMGLVGLISFLYPIRFLTPERRADVLRGLGTVLLVVTPLTYLFYRVCRAFGSEPEPN